MKRDKIPSLEDEPLAVQTLYPDPDYFSSWDAAQEERISEIEEHLADRNPDVLGITHTDADGYGCEVMLREAYPNKDVAVLTAAQNGPHSLEQMGSHIANNISKNTEIYIMDLSPNEGDGRKFIDPFRSFGNVNVYDHHQWTDNDYEQVDWEADVTINTDKCATQIVHDKLIDIPREQITEFAEITQDHDLWIKEQREKSDKLAHLAQQATRQKYVELARNHGINMIETEAGEEMIQKQQEKLDRMVEIALNRTDYYTVGEYNIGITYGEYDASNVGEELYENQNVDLACIIYPNGNVSLRTPEDTPVALDVAREINGGGHKCAAGGKIKMVGKGINYTTHWATKGKASKESLIDTIKDVLS